MPYGKNRVPKQLLKDSHPDLFKEWDYFKNKEIDPLQVATHSHKNVYWICSKNKLHKWRAIVNNRSKGNNGPTCSNRVVSKYNSLAFTHPQLLEEWDYKKNYPLSPEKITAGSHAKVYWKCLINDDHSWAARIDQRIFSRGKGTNCPYCVGKIASNENNLSKSHSELVNEWHPTKNTLKITDVTAGSSRMAWWVCPVDSSHVWEARISSRVEGWGCPYCSKFKVNYSNSLEKTHPRLAKEWHPTQNGKLKPKDVTSGSTLYAWWQCSKDSEHVWKAEIRNRGKGRDCPVCGSLKNKSENILLKIVEELFPKEQVLYRARPEFLGRKELDIYLPSLKIAIEYMGKQHYQPIDYFGGEEAFLFQRERDLMKSNLCWENNITLIYFSYKESLTLEHIKEKLSRFTPIDGKMSDLFLK